VVLSILLSRLSPALRDRRKLRSTARAMWLRRRLPCAKNRLVRIATRGLLRSAPDGPFDEPELIASRDLHTNLFLWRMTAERGSRLPSPHNPLALFRQKGTSHAGDDAKTAVLVSDQPSDP